MGIEPGTLLCRALAALAIVAAHSAQAQSPDPIPIAAFFQYPALSKGEISPSGRHLVILAGSPTSRQELLLVDTKTLEGHALASYKDADIVDVHWVSDTRVVFRPADLGAGLEDDRAARVGLLAVDITGKNLRKLPPVAFLSAFRDVDSDKAIVLAPKTDRFWKFESWVPFVIDTRAPFTWLSPKQIEDRAGATTWLFGPDNGARVATGMREGHPFAMAWDEAAQKWRGIGGKLEDGHPVAVAPDGALLVEHRGADQQMAALYRFDMNTLSYDAEPLVSAKDFDIDATVLMDSRRLLGVRYRTDAVATVWFDDKLAAIQKDIDAALPGRTNEVQAPLRPEVPLVLVNSYSDRDPGVWYLFNTVDKTLSKVGEAMPGIDARRMGKRELVRYKARDGLEIPAWLTLPAGAAKDAHLPMVVLVHGGPYVQAADWRWDADPQFLASRGYAVLEPQYRGTLGYGLRHFEAGIKQWGLSMQDDLADGTRWAIEQGIADAGRVCIAGASYGGYASTMGLIKDPDLFRCGIDWAGPTDIDLIYGAWFSDWTDNSKAALSILTADRDKDAEQIKATSPLRLAEKIRAPVLLAYGGEDKRVPITHGRRFRWNLERTNKDVEWIEYSEEGHGWRTVRNRVDFWRRVEAFLARNIGSARAEPARVKAPGTP